MGKMTEMKRMEKKKKQLNNKEARYGSFNIHLVFSRCSKAERQRKEDN